MITIRKPAEADIPFILNSYYLCLRNSQAYKEITNDVASTYLNPIITNILVRSDILLAVDSESDDVILGYIVTSYETEARIPTVHMIYVKKIYRSMGVAKKLFNELLVQNHPLLITCHTPAGMAVLKKLSKSVVFYNPFLLSTNV